MRIAVAAATRNIGARTASSPRKTDGSLRRADSAIGYPACRPQRAQLTRNSHLLNTHRYRLTSASCGC
jgi:hypothetical protein